MLYAYDLDGTLADTRSAVLSAYRQVGVEPPEDFFGKPWRDWLADPVLHDRKNVVYKSIPVRPTRILDIYLRTGGIIITGASREAAEMVMYKIGITGPVHCELSKQQKAAVLNAHGLGGIVFEDSLINATYLKEHTEWTVCLVL